MRTLLVLALHPGLAEALREALDPSHYRVLLHSTIEESEPFLTHSLVDALVLDGETAGSRILWTIERARRLAPRCPVIIYAGSSGWEWEEEAYAAGVSHVLTKPVRARVARVVLDRLWPQNKPETPPTAALPPVISQARGRSGPALGETTKALEILRDFSEILSHSLQAEPLFRQFLMRLREILGVNRAAIFIRRPTSLLAQGESPQGIRRLRSACAIGLSPGLLEHFELSFESGIGGHLFRSGRILRREAPESLGDPEMQKEFELLGAQVAVPMFDHDNLVGVAALDGRVTGQPLADEELELVFHLLEQLGFALRNIWLHEQLAANHEMMVDVLRHLNSACVVVSRDLVILHANRMARKFFGKPGRMTEQFEFSDLPNEISSQVYRVLQTGAATTPFPHRSSSSPASIFQVAIVPFQKQSLALPASVLMVAEDRTQSEQLRRLELETANLRLIKTMADRLTHEIGNALVPLSTHQQLLGEKFRDPEFRTSLDHALAEGVKRIARLTSQLRFLARDSLVSKDPFALLEVIEEAHQEAMKHHHGKASRLKCENPGQPIIVAGDRGALKHALAEVMLNALQAAPSDARVGVKFQSETDPQGEHWVHIEIQDAGQGFTPEAAQHVLEPFFTTRNVGLGLGLTVSQKIVETHHGRLAILDAEGAKTGRVRISLPLSNGLAG